MRSIDLRILLTPGLRALDDLRIDLHRIDLLQQLESDRRTRSRRVVRLTGSKRAG